MVGVEFASARGIVALLGQLGVVGLSTFAVNLLTSLSIAAGTDYAIFLIGRYQEARQAGEDREAAYYTTYHGVAHVILGSGLTISGATFCLGFAPVALLSIPGDPLRGRHAGRRRGGAHAGAGSSACRQSIWSVRPQTDDRGSRMAPGGHCRRPLAGARSCRGMRHLPHRPPRAARLSAPATTTDNMYPTTCRPTPDTRRPTGTSPRPG